MAFKKGQGRIAGRQKGAKNKTTILFENLLIENRAELLSKAIELAKEGNERILLKLLDKIVPTLNSIENKGIDGIPNIRILIENPANPMASNE
jgi:hypothetical protein